MDTTRRTSIDRLLLLGCAVSLVCYLVTSSAVRAFAREVARLVAKF